MTGPYASFLTSVKTITEQIGENMEAFVIVWSAKKKNHPAKNNFPGSSDDDLLHTWMVGGPDQVVNQEVMHMVSLLLDRYVNNCRGNAALALNILIGDITKEHLNRERQRKP